MILMERLGTREVMIRGEEVMAFLNRYPQAHLEHDYNRVTDELQVFLEGADNGLAN